MSCSNNASRPLDVIVRAPDLFDFARPNAPSLAAISVGIGGGSRFASVAPFSLRNQSKSSAVRFESMTTGWASVSQLLGLDPKLGRPNFLEPSLEPGPIPLEGLRQRVARVLAERVRHEELTCLGADSALKRGYPLGDRTDEKRGPTITFIWIAVKVQPPLDKCSVPIH